MVDAERSKSRKGDTDLRRESDLGPDFRHLTSNNPRPGYQAELRFRSGTEFFNGIDPKQPVDLCWPWPAYGRVDYCQLSVVSSFHGDRTEQWAKVRQIAGDDVLHAVSGFEVAIDTEH